MTCTIEDTLIVYLLLIIIIFVFWFSGGDKIQKWKDWMRNLVCKVNLMVDSKKKTKREKEPLCSFFFLITIDQFFYLICTPFEV